MATVLCYTSPARGHLFPITPVLRELHARGHQIALRTIETDVAAMSGLGFHAEPVDPRIVREKFPVIAHVSPLAELKTALQVFGRRAVLEVPDLHRAIDGVRPDMLIIDTNAWGACAVAERWSLDTGRPWVQFLPYTPALPSPDVPPFGPGLTPWPGPLGRVRNRILNPVVYGMLTRALRPALNEVRREVGLPLARTAADAVRRGTLNLVMTAAPFEYPRTDWPASFLFVGPLTWEPPAAAPAWLSDVRDPIILVTTSSELQADSSLIATALDAFRDQPVHVVATAPAGIRETYDVPANAHVETFIPHGLLLDRAAVAITHGGMGATQKALQRGVPVCVVPFGRDQHEVARRVTQSRCGTTVKPHRLTPETLRSGVARALNCTDGVERVREGYAATGGERAAADAVEQLLHR